MSIDNYSTFGDSLEKIYSGQEAVIVEIEKFECLKQNSIVADLAWCLELYLILELALEPTIINKTSTLQFRIRSLFWMKLSDIL